MFGSCCAVIALLVGIPGLFNIAALDQLFELVWSGNVGNRSDLCPSEQ